MPAARGDALPPDSTPAPCVDSSLRAGEEYPNLRAIAQGAAADPAAFPVDFEFGLDVLLEGLGRRQPATGEPARTIADS